MGYGRVLLFGLISITAGAIAGPVFLAFGIICTIISLIIVAARSRNKKKQAQIKFTEGWNE